MFGKADGTAVNLSDVANGIGGFVVNGIDAGDHSGVSVSRAGFINRDQLADVIVGARDADPGGNNSAGESYVVFGKADGTAVNLSDVGGGSGGFVIIGIDPFDYSGVSVSVCPAPSCFRFFCPPPMRSPSPLGRRGPFWAPGGCLE